jgi:hypothetical protein
VFNLLYFTYIAIGMFVALQLTRLVLSDDGDKTVTSFADVAEVIGSVVIILVAGCAWPLATFLYFAYETQKIIRQERS